MSNKPNSQFNFSQAMAELEEITKYLEGETTDLDEAIAKFERGSEIAQQMKQYLTQAQNRVDKLRANFDKDQVDKID